MGLIPRGEGAPDADRKWTPAAEPAFRPVDPNELASSCSEACVDLDLAQRVAAMRSIVPDRIVFTTSFGIETSPKNRKISATTTPLVRISVICSLLTDARIVRVRSVTIWISTDGGLDA
jgi:hypothetical protein